MFKLQCLFLCVCYAVVVSIASKVPFIDKCKWDDTPCLLKSSQKALPFVAAGVPDIGLSPLDPVHLDKVEYNEGGLSIIFEDMTLKGTSKCQLKKVERNTADSALFVDAECPIEVKGIYTAKGKILIVPIEGHGKFTVATDNVFISLKVGLTYVDGEDGVPHWQVGSADYTFDFKEKAHLIFENLFGGDKEKSDAVNAVLSEHWKELALSLGKPIVDEVINKVKDTLNGIARKVPASDLEH